MNVNNVVLLCTVKMCKAYKQSSMDITCLKVVNGQILQNVVMTSTAVAEYVIYVEQSQGR